MSSPIVAIRPATVDDAAVLARLAALDSAEPLEGDVLLGVVDGEPVAALAVRDDRAIADPFRPTADIVALLALRAARLRAAQGDGVVRLARFRRRRLAAAA